MPFTCSICGEIHDALPALGFKAPDAYDEFAGELPEGSIQINDDVCIIKHPDQTDRFIGGVIKQLVIDYPDTLDYGVWVTLSEKSFTDYEDHYSSTDHVVTYFGYLSNTIPGYENTRSLKTNVNTQEGTTRPDIIPHRDQMDNPFVRDYYNGITLEEAQKRVHAAFDP